MSVILHYWKPEPHEISGHTALTIDNEFVSFWAGSPDKETGAPCTSCFSDTLENDCLILGLRKLIHPAFIAAKIDLPAGMWIYQALIDALKKNISIDEMRESLLNWKNQFLKTDSKEALDHKNTQINLICNFISDYFSKEKITVETLLADAKNGGQPSDSIVLSGLNVDEMLLELQHLKKNKDNLLWAAQVGSRTDRDLTDTKWNRTNLLWKFPGANLMPGLKGFQKGKIRHNCSSMILSLLQVGGISLKQYKERPADRLREMIALNENDTPEQKEVKLKKIDMISLLPKFSMARHCGTTPHEVYGICLHYCAHNYINCDSEVSRALRCLVK